MVVGVVLICGVMFAGPLTSHASPADPFAVTPVKAVGAAKVKSQPRFSLVERIAALRASPDVRQTAFDLAVTTAADFGDWDQTWEHDAPH